MNYFEVKITKTARPMGNNVDWQIYDHERKEFATLRQAKKWLDDQYFYCKTKVRSYVDDKNGNPKTTGWIYCFKSDPVSYDDCKHFEQHWIEIYKVNSRLTDF